MSECTNDCASCGESCPDRTEKQTDFRAKANELSYVKKVIAVVSGKGGVGKSPVASMMNIPVPGLVENMSCMVCPDCGKKLMPFGESHADAIVQRHGIPSVARVPIDTRLAAVCDKGAIELFDGNRLDPLFNHLEKTLGFVK